MTRGASCILLVACALLAACQVRTGRRLLQQGEPRRVLAVVRPVSAEAYIVRAQALERLGRLERARTALLIGLALDERSAEGHRLLGFIERQLGALRAARRAFERSLALQPDQVCVRRALARLEVWRAWYRLHPAVGLLQRKEAGEELRRAHQLDPCLKTRTEALPALARAQPATARVPGCPGPSRDDARWSRPLGGGPCRLPRASLVVERFFQRDLLLGCRGDRLARRLEDAGCLVQAQRVWSALALEAPSEPVWQLALARVLLARGQQARARLALTDHVYLSGDRAAAHLRAARVLLASGDRKLAARHAVEVLPHATRVEQQLEAIGILRRCKRWSQARQAARVVLERRWPLPPAKVRALVDRAMNRPPQTPPR